PLRLPPPPPLFPYTTLFRSHQHHRLRRGVAELQALEAVPPRAVDEDRRGVAGAALGHRVHEAERVEERERHVEREQEERHRRERSEEHTSELQSRFDLVCRL